MNLQEHLQVVERVHQLIRLKATGTPTELANRLRMSESSVYRLICEMRNIGFPIVFDKERKCYCYTKTVLFSFKVRTLEETDEIYGAAGRKF